MSQTICVCSTHEQLFIPICSQEMLLVPCSYGRWDCFLFFKQKLLRAADGCFQECL